MAHENIQVKTPNFCLSPIDGSFCNINTENPTTVLDVKNKGGALITSFSFSFNIIGDIRAIEYVGPIRSYKFINDLVFFTLEHVTDSKALIKLWEVDIDHMKLNLKKIYTLSDTGLYHYNVNGMAVEIVRRQFSKDRAAGDNQIYINDLDSLYEGQRLFLGPSFDPDNLGEIEVVHVAAIDPVHSLITLTNSLKYDYVKTDRISFYKSIYITSKGGIGADTTKGTLFKINPETAALEEVTNNGIYKQVSVARWCEEFYSIALVCGLNVLYVDPYDSYKVSKSQMINNYKDDQVTPYTVNDVCFDNTDIFKLSNKAVFRTDTGDLQLVKWDKFYNFQQDTLAPYAHNITNYSANNFTIGSYATTVLNLIVRDQFNVTLRDVDVKATIIPGDTGALLDPLSGRVTTDKDGKAELIYRSGATFEGMTKVTYETNEGSNFTGSEWVWSHGYIKSFIEFPTIGDTLTFLIFQRSWYIGQNQTALHAIYPMFKVPHGGNINTMVYPNFNMIAKNYFTTPGADWARKPSGKPEIPPKWLPQLVNYGPDDGPTDEFTIWDGDHLAIKANMCDVLHQWAEAEGSVYAPSYDKFLVYNYDYTDEHGHDHYGMVPSPVWLRQTDIYKHMTFSQLKLSLHTNWVDGNPYDELFTTVDIDQFIFVEDAIPKFWSRKNPVDTNIWIRLRPFAHNLDANTVVMKIRELSYEEDTGYYDISHKISMQYYDAGSGLLGIEILYEPDEAFRHKAVVYVHIELYDTAPFPNKIYVNYWFVIIPDYKGPYLDKLIPESGATNIPIDTSIGFDIKDAGTGVDIDSLDITVNSRLVYPQEITKITKRHYRIKYTPATPFRFGEEVIVRVQCIDRSEQANLMRVSYPFYIDPGDDIEFLAEQPLRCEWGVPRFSDVRMVALGTGGGIDAESLRLQIYGKDVTNDAETHVLPIIYRVA